MCVPRVLRLRQPPVHTRGVGSRPELLGDEGELLAWLGFGSGSGSGSGLGFGFGQEFGLAGGLLAWLDAW